MSRPEAAVWREDIEALAFRLERHQGACVVHRLAFRTLLGTLPTEQDCLGYFAAHRAGFEAAAAAKIAGKQLSPMVNFHLTSREIGSRI
jgi:hypothetical protein